MSNPRRSAKKTSQPVIVKPASVKAALLQVHAQKALRKWLKVVSGKPVLKKRIAGLQTRDFHVDLSLISTKKMTELNLQYRGEAYPTDVLSFPADEVFQVQGLLGDLVICSPVLFSQAEEVGNTWKDELDVLLVHGILHLLHFDHEKGKKEAAEMLKWEKKLLGAKVKRGLIQRSQMATVLLQPCK